MSQAFHARKAENSMFSLSGQIALVTGGSQGIGRAIALALAERGAEVAVMARSREKCEAVAAEAREFDRRALAIRADLTDAEDVRRAVAGVVAEFGGISILVNNAAITRDGLMLRMPREDWESVMRTNLTGVFVVTQQALPLMVKARYGRIINLTSVAGQAGNAGQVNYAAAKAGLIGFTKSLARECAARNITVNALAPGLIETPMTEAMSASARAAALAQIPLGRFGTDREVACAAAFLASPEASYITGQTFGVNGGLYL
jgi:3-oxoacyl-[acyl-carrier protein] reductase